jgi:Holliday junction resolvase
MHKIEGMVNVKDKTCVSEWCETIPGKRYKGYCVLCFVHLFPDLRVSRDYKTRERTVVDFLMAAVPSVTWIYNKRVSNGCSKYQPDLLCDLGDQVLMVEIDENQHATYDCSCENKRLMELSRDVGHRPLVVIRFNPDRYVDARGQKHTSCFGVDGRGMVCVAASKRSEWNDRLACLRSTVLYWTEARTDKTVEVVSLFFTSS